MQRGGLAVAEAAVASANDQERRLGIGLLEMMIRRSKYLRSTGRLNDRKSESEMAYLEELLRRGRQAEQDHPGSPVPLRLPVRLDERLTRARLHELRAFHAMVCADSRSLRDESQRLVATFQASRRVRWQARQEEMGRTTSPPAAPTLELARAMFKEPEAREASP